MGGGRCRRRGPWLARGLGWQGAAPRGWGGGGCLTWVLAGQCMPARLVGRDGGSGPAAGARPSGTGGAAPSCGSNGALQGVAGEPRTYTRPAPGAGARTASRRAADAADDDRVLVNKMCGGGGAHGLPAGRRSGSEGAAGRGAGGPGHGSRSNAQGRECRMYTVRGQGKWQVQVAKNGSGPGGGPGRPGCFVWPPV
jgi:hypothetical protein